MAMTRRWLPGLLALATFLPAQRALAQYTGEIVVCTDGRSPDACRATQIPADPNTGVVTWSRSLGSTLCFGVGIVPQDTDCNFFGNSYNGFDCHQIQDIFFARVAAGLDLAIGCGDIAPLDDGNYSAQATRNNCFDDTAVCGNFVLVTP
jgi:hypothetical protein